MKDPAAEMTGSMSLVLLWKQPGGIPQPGKLQARWGTPSWGEAGLGSLGGSPGDTALVCLVIFCGPGFPSPGLALNGQPPQERESGGTPKWKLITVTLDSK